MAQQRVLIAMSGGVDSSVAACQMQRAGFACAGAMMRLYDSAEATREGACCSLDDAEDARSVAYRLGMPFYVFNFTDDFRERVMDRFVRCYESGLTPNPCIDCNRCLKFDRFLTRAQTLGFTHMATGHYARITRDASSGRYLLRKAADAAKDQSYVLYMLTQAQLAHIYFPLGELTKAEVRGIAQREGFLNAHKRDSQDICFVPDGDYTAFLRRYSGRAYPEGDFLDADGAVIGKHRGAVCYTLGQRRGLGLATGGRVYVCAKDMARNTVTVGPEAALYHSALRGSDWNWFPFEALEAPMRVTAKTRYRQSEQSATVYPEGGGFARVEFDAPQRAVTPGQAVVLYDGDAVVGGGTITQVLA